MNKQYAPDAGKARILALTAMLLLGGCGNQQPADNRASSASIETEVLSQLHEVIRYEDEQQRLKHARLSELGVLPAAAATEIQPNEQHQQQ
jgi:hypothetical protein